MDILIIGCGYLGERAATSWMSQGIRVHALTRSEEHAARWRQQGLVPVVGDVMRPETLDALQEADLCLYAVGYDRTAEHDKPAVYVDGLRNVLDVVRGRVPRIIYVSSTSVYGQNDGTRVDESSACQPQREGGRICLAAEQALREFYPVAKSESMPQSVILRLAGIYGPGRLIGRLDQLHSATPLQVNPDGWLNLIHVDDAVQAVMAIGERPHCSPLYLLSDATPLRRREFYGTLAELAGAPTPTFAAVDRNAVNKRCDSSLIRKELELTLRYPIARDGLAALTPFR